MRTHATGTSTPGSPVTYIISRFSDCDEQYNWMKRKRCDPSLLRTSPPVLEKPLEYP
jgi:hypothetical protein